METIKIFTTGGATALEQDLSEERGPLLLVEKEGTLRLVASVAAGDRLLGAFIRTADGWDLAAADAANPVRSGPKSAGSMPLVAGASLLLGEFVFVLETSQTASTVVLLWRVGKSRIAADSVLPGRNVVGIDQLTGHVAVNPAVLADLSFEFYLTSDGIDAVGFDGTHLSVPQRIRFACGDFEGMVLNADEAAAAMKSRDPFGHPSRHIRQGLLLATIGAVVVFAGALSLNRQATEIERATAKAPGPEVTVAASLDAGASSFGDGYVFQLSVLRDMKRILGPKPAAEAADLIVRSQTLQPSAEVKRTVDFLKEVTEIQTLANANRWDELKALLKKADDSVYVSFDALAFLKDARALTVFICDDLPREIRKALFGSAEERARAVAGTKESFSKFSGNVFVQSDAVRGYGDRVVRRFETAATLAGMRDAVMASKDYSVETLENLRGVLLQLNAEFDEAGYRPSAEELRKALAAWTVKEVSSILAAYKPGQTAPDVSFARVTPLCDLAEDTGVDPTTVATWRTTAKEIDRQLNQRYRELYQKYRLGGAMDDAEALKIVDEMLAIGGTGGKFRNWALREKDRLQKAKEVK